MRVVQPKQFKLGELAIGEIQIDPRSRDDIPAILKGLQLIYTDPVSREKLFSLLEQTLDSSVDQKNGRPGMALWSIFVLATLKQGLDCNYDRLQELANQHLILRQMLGHTPWEDETHYAMQTLVDNVSLLKPPILAEISQLVVETGHKVVKKKPGDALCGRCDSFVVETDVDYPTDTHLLWTAMGKVIKDTAGACKRYRVGGWRQHQYQLSKLKKHYRRSQKIRFPKTPQNEQQEQKRQQAHQAYRAYLDQSLALLKKAQATLVVLTERGALAEVLGIDVFIQHGYRQIDQIDRRILQDQTIPHEEKVFSLFEPHTRWLSKGKVGVPVELGVATCVLADQYQFVLHHQIMWAQSDVQVAVEMVKQAQVRFADLKQCSFDRGFHSAGNYRQLDEPLDHTIMPKQGRLSQADKARESDPHFVKARRQHSAIESCINGLEHHGLRRCRAHGKDGFERTVALSVVAYNLHRLGTFLQRKEKARLIRKAKREKKQQELIRLAA